MEKRRFGRTNHRSAVAIFGTAAFYEISQEDAHETMEYVLSTEINHIDVAPGYGDAEERMGPWLANERDRFFVGCKTIERAKEEATKELRLSLKKLKIDKFDLYQLHAVATLEELDQVMKDGGAMQAIVEAKQEGLTDYIGITSHGWETPDVLLEALNRFDFDTLLFPINPNFFANPEYKEKTETVLKLCKKRDVGTMIIKPIAKGSWGNKEKNYTTWYEPYDTPEEIQMGIDFALSQDVTGICTAADVNLLPLVVDACEKFTPMNLEKQSELIERAKTLTPIFEIEE
jgi:predicted aldo/keto reductase-like oxidoreductase